jgi:hypothetical protein
MFMSLAPSLVSSVRLVWTHDPDSEPDYLETTAQLHYGKDGAAWSHVPEADLERVKAEFGSVWDACVAYANQDAERLSRFKAGDWWFEGCYAVAEISYENSTRSYRLDKLRSAGLWGIESDSGSEYRKSVEADELADLSQHLEKFGISASVDDLIALSENSSY